MFEQLRTLDKRRIIDRVGHLDSLSKEKVNNALKVSIFNLEEKTPLERLPKYTQNEINKTIQKIYSYDDVIESSITKEVIDHLSKDRKILLNHLERLCKDNELDYTNYYSKTTKYTNKVAM